MINLTFSISNFTMKKNKFLVPLNVSRTFQKLLYISNLPVSYIPTEIFERTYALLSCYLHLQLLMLCPGKWELQSLKSSLHGLDCAQEEHI
jgi:hypothetical protein